MSPRRRPSLMRFCTCRHGQGAHRNGAGPCFGERMLVGRWHSCQCMAFELAPDETGPDETGPGETREAHETSRTEGGET